MKTHHTDIYLITSFFPSRGEILSGCWYFFPGKDLSQTCLQRSHNSPPLNQPDSCARGTSGTSKLRNIGELESARPGRQLEDRTVTQSRDVSRLEGDLSEDTRAHKPSVAK